MYHYYYVNNNNNNNPARVQSVQAIVPAQMYVQSCAMQFTQHTPDMPGLFDITENSKIATPKD